MASLDCETGAGMTTHDDDVRKISICSFRKTTQLFIVHVVPSLTTINLMALSCDAILRQVCDLVLSGNAKGRLESQSSSAKGAKYNSRPEVNISVVVL